MLMRRMMKLTLAEARQWAEDLNAMDEARFCQLTAGWAAHKVDVAFEDPYVDLRLRLVDAFDRAGGLTLVPRKMYPVDVEVGLELYCALCEHHFTVEDACNDDFWRYLSVVVCPDLTYLRYPDPEKAQKQQGGRINHMRFFGHTRRIWLKTLWWYVFLSWQGDVDSTREVIRDNGSDIISHFIETPGRGYRPELYRAFMKRYSKCAVRKAKVFNNAAKVNGARCRVIEPELSQGGVEGYCDRLFVQLGDKVGE